jgi:hypothetical protein
LPLRAKVLRVIGTAQFVVIDAVDAAKDPQNRVILLMGKCCVEGANVGDRIVLEKKVAEDGFEKYFGQKALPQESKF